VYHPFTRGNGRCLFCIDKGRKIQSPRSCPDRPIVHIDVRLCPHALTRFDFRGVSEYLEELVARIDTPLLNYGYNHLPSSHISHSTTRPVHQSRTKAQGTRSSSCDLRTAVVALPSPQTAHRILDLKISCSQSDWRLSFMVQICSSSLHLVAIWGLTEMTYSKSKNRGRSDATKRMRERGEPTGQSGANTSCGVNKTTRDLPGSH
jgi:hypothetical protein